MTLSIAISFAVSIVVALVETRRRLLSRERRPVEAQIGMRVLEGLT
jgi:hypothetical protein